jgi:antitoxin component YwqK of YwqJK toxin-antitoxin module
MKTNALLFLLFVPALSLVACNKPMGTTKAPPAPHFGDDQYDQPMETESVPYDVETRPQATQGSAQLDERWWTSEGACPEGSTLFGGEPPEHQRVGCKTDKGKNVGRTADFFENGAKKEEGQYQDHFAEGVWTAWDEEGHRISETTFRRGNKEGIETIWYPGGEIKSQRSYKNGKRDGITYIWDDRARLRTALPYRAGVKHGPEARYSIEGDLARVIHWNQGKSDEKDEK